MGIVKLPQKKPHLVDKFKPNVRQRMAALQNKNIVAVIRKHPLLGRGTESVVDQAFTDEEILEELDREKITTASKAIQHFAVWEGVDIEDEDAGPIGKARDEFDDFDESVWWKEWDKLPDD